MANCRGCNAEIPKDPRNPNRMTRLYCTKKCEMATSRKIGKTPLTGYYIADKTVLDRFEELRPLACLGQKAAIRELRRSPFHLRAIWDKDRGKEVRL